MIEFGYRGQDGCALSAALILPVAANSTDQAPTIVLLHGGGPDHHSLVPLANQLADLYTIVLPDIRGYGRSVCRDPQAHTWARYVDDLIALLDHLRVERAVLGGAGLGSTIALRAAIANPSRIHSLLLISIEEIEDDDAKKAEIEFMDAFAERVRSEGIESAWEPILPALAPIIGTMVRDAIPRTDPASIAAAAAIGRDRSFRSVDELRGIVAPTLIFPGIDSRHPAALAKQLAAILPNAQLSTERFTDSVRTTEDFAVVLAPPVRDFLAHTAR